MAMTIVSSARISVLAIFSYFFGAKALLGAKNPLASVVAQKNAVDSTVTVTVFKDVQEKCGQVLFREGWLKIKGTVQRRGPKSLSIIANELQPVTSRSNCESLQ